MSVCCSNYYPEIPLSSYSLEKRALKNPALKPSLSVEAEDVYRSALIVSEKILPFFFGQELSPELSFLSQASSFVKMFYEGKSLFDPLGSVAYAGAKLALYRQIQTQPALAPLSLLLNAYSVFHVASRAWNYFDLCQKHATLNDAVQVGLGSAIHSVNVADSFYDFTALFSHVFPSLPEGQSASTETPDVPHPETMNGSQAPSVSPTAQSTSTETPDVPHPETMNGSQVPSTSSSAESIPTETPMTPSSDPVKVTEPKAGQEPQMLSPEKLKQMSNDTRLCERLGINNCDENLPTEKVVKRAYRMQRMRVTEADRRNDATIEPNLLLGKQYLQNRIRAETVCDQVRANWEEAVNENKPRLLEHRAIQILIPNEGFLGRKSYWERFRFNREVADFRKSKNFEDKIKAHLQVFNRLYIAAKKHQNYFGNYLGSNDSERQSACKAVVEDAYKYLIETKLSSKILPKK